MFRTCIRSRDIAFIFSVCLNYQIIETASSGVNFKIDFMTTSIEPTAGFLTKYGISLEDCARECSGRRRCGSAGYSRTRQTCVLMSKTAGQGTHTGTLSYVQVRKEDILTASTCSCSLNEACVDGANGNSCEAKECESLHVENGGFLGNRVSVGSVLKFECHEGYVHVGQTDTTTCMGSGNWSIQPTCLYDCGEPPKVPNAFITAGETLAGSQRTYECRATYAMVHTAQTSTATIKCLGSSKVWSSSNVKCLKDCGEPTVGTHASLLPGNTTAGSERTYVCSPGYVLVTDTSSSEFVVECMTAGHWSSEAAICTRDCGEPKLGTHASLLPGNTTAGSERTYVCSPGYVLVTDTSSTEFVVECMTTGHWSSEAATCTRDCGEPKLGTHASLLPGNTTAGSERTYVCSPGYVLVTDTSSTEFVVECMTTGHWSSEAATCTRDCGEPKLGTHASLLPGNTTAGSERTYVCSPGYVLVTNTSSSEFVVECMTAGHWSSEAVICTPDCGEPKLGTHASLMPGNTTAGSKRTYICSPGYVLVTDTSSSEFVVECMTAGHWSSEAAICIRDCGEPQLGTHASLLPGITTAGSDRTYVCSPGYVLVTDTSSTEFVVECMAAGQWSSEAAICIRDCGEPKLGIHASLLPGNSTAGSMRTYVCSFGYVLVTDASSTKFDVECMADGHWSSEAAICTPVIKHDCRDIQYYGQTVTGVYSITLDTTNETISVLCDMDAEGGGWTVFQNRFDGSVNFYRTLSEYENGFGIPQEEHWLGLRYIYELTRGPTQLNIELVAADGTRANHAFENFAVAADPYYTLDLSGPSGTAGNPSYGILYNNGHNFSTYDRDVSGGCAALDNAGWWFGNCAFANLNGFYGVPGSTTGFNGRGEAAMTYRSFKGFESLKTSRMMLRRVNN